MSASEPGVPKTTDRAIDLLLGMGADLVGKDPARAIECLREAADLAEAAGDVGREAAARRRLGAVLASRGETAAASDALDRAIALARAASDDLAIAACLNALGALRHREGDPDEALAFLRESLGRTPDASRDPEAASVRGETLETLGAVYRDEGDPQQAFLYWEEALEIRRAAGDEAGIASCRNHLGTLSYRMGRFAEAESHFELALAARTALGDRRGIASTTNNLAGTCLLLGKLREAAAHFERSLALAEELGDRRRTASILSNMGLLRTYEGRADEAEELHRRSLALHRELDDPVGQGHVLNNLADLAVERGRLDDAIRHADECREIWTRAGRREALGKPWVNRGRALIELGRLPEAREAAESALAAAEATRSDEYRAEAGALLARVLAAEGREEEAIAAAREAAEAAGRAGSPPLRAQCATELGRLHVEAGDLEAAKQELERAARLVRGLPHPYDRACILAEQGRLLGRAGTAEAGAKRLRAALSEFETLGNVRWQVRVLADLAGMTAGTDRAEAERLRARAAALADRHDLRAELDRVERRRARGDEEAGSTPGPAVRADDLEGLTAAWSEAARRGEDRPADIVDPLFRHLRQRHRVASAELTIPGAPTEAARFVLGIPGDPVDPAGRLEVSMSTTSNPEARLRLRRNEPFEDDEVVSIRAVTRVAALALAGPLERLGRREAARPEPDEDDRFEGLLGSAPAMREVYRLIDRVASADSSVLLLGESGTGKELAARAIHARSPRRDRPFVAINCPSIPQELIEAELFGHEKGAFTGANVARPGKVEIADGGTLFLDEVGDMALATQVRLLRFLEEREFQRVGGRENRRVDVRILAATSRDLAEAVEAGRFRSDLFYRLNVVPVRMPSLRERRDDLPRLVDHFLERFAREGRPLRLTGRALELLRNDPWPGNVRELRNAIENMATLAEEDVLDVDRVPEAIRERAEARRGAPAPPLAGGAPGAAPGLRPGETMEARLQEVEAALLRATLEAEEWNQSATARRLGITESKVRNRMRQYGLRKPDRNRGDSP
jgi:DNA-binding NtrC family response regulator/tetratricopeptide (TPR) repeat protein